MSAFQITYMLPEQKACGNLNCEAIVLIKCTLNN